MSCLLAVYAAVRFNVLKILLQTFYFCARKASWLLPKHRVMSELFSQVLWCQLQPNCPAPPPYAPSEGSSQQASLRHCVSSPQSSLHLPSTSPLSEYLMISFSLPNIFSPALLKLSMRFAFSKEWLGCDGILSHAPKHGTGKPGGKMTQRDKTKHFN